MRTTTGWLLSLIVLAVPATWAAPANDANAEGPPAEGETILNTRSYWRSYYVLKPAQTSTRLWKTVPIPPGHKRLVEWEKRGRPLEELEGRFVHYTFCGHWATSPILDVMDSPAPPQNWYSPQFDDSTWVRTKYPMLMQQVGVDQICPPIDTDVGLQGVARACFRSRFFVEDPAKVKKVVLKIAYRGGMVAWLNGEELGRGHVPGGPVTEEATATEYEEADYCLPPRDDLEPILSGMKGFSAGADWKGLLPKFKGKSRAIGDIGGSYWEGLDQIHYYFRAPITPDEYDTLLKRRDRELTVEIEPAKLRKGVNVLALLCVRADLHPVIAMGSARMGPAAHYGWSVMFKGLSWLHNGIVNLELKASPAGAVQPNRRPTGVQVWVESPNKRLFAPEFGEPRDDTPLLRMVGARSGTYAGQVAIGSDRALQGLSVKPGDLTAAGGAKIPASAVSVRYLAPRPIRDLSPLGYERHPQHDAKNPMGSSDTWTAMWRYGKRDANGNLPYRRLGQDGSEAREAALQEVKFFDEIVSNVPAQVPAGTCQPMWVSVKVPADAKAELYAGTIQISCEGVEPVDVPIRLQVMDWKLPDPSAGEDFTTMVGMEQSPWGVAKAHKVEPWSDEHFQHIEHSLKRMGELGNDYLIIPVLLNSEFGNREDSFIVWNRARDGSLSCDFSRFDRYMDLAQKYMPKPAVVCFGVIHPEDNYLWVTPKVLVRDEATGKTEPATLPMGEVNPFKDKREMTADERAETIRFLKPFVDGVLTRMEKRGIKDSVFWGYAWDYTVSVGRYQDIYKELAPAVKWARGCHGHGDANHIAEPFGFQGSIVCLPQPVRKIPDGPRKGSYEIYSQKGWKSKNLHLSLPRTQNAVLCVIGGAVPYYWRIYPELALCGGARGICRIGADYWEASCQDGWTGGGQVGLGLICSFWPGKEEAHSSARFEMLREGLQEAEARVAIEKALEGSLKDSPDAARIQKMLNNRITATMHIMRCYYTARPGEQDFGWQERSWDLYASAVQAGGGKAPTEAEKQAFFATPGK